MDSFAPRQENAKELVTEHVTWCFKVGTTNRLGGFTILLLHWENRGLHEGVAW